MIRRMLLCGYSGINVMRRRMASSAPLVMVVRNPMAQRGAGRGDGNREACEGPEKREASESHHSRLM